MLRLMLFSLCAACCSGYVLQPNKPIIGGYEVTHINQVPYQLSVEYQQVHVCGATVITHLWAVTAAHCVNGTSDLDPNQSDVTSDLRLRSESTRLNQGGILHEIDQIIVNQNYNTVTLDYDIALIRIVATSPFKSSSIIPTAETRPGVGVSVAVSGWGRLSDDPRSTVVYRLRKVEVPMIEQDECKSMYEPLNRLISSRMVCAGLDEGGADACVGDDGGPMVHEGQLVGIVSWGRCGKPYPGVYTNIAELRKWILWETRNTTESNSSSIQVPINYTVLSIFMVSTIIWTNY